MKQFDGALSQLSESDTSFVDSDSNLLNPVFHKQGLAGKLKYTLSQAFGTLQTIIIWLLFLYIPVYAGLLFFNIINFVSLFSLYYFISYIVIIVALIMINYEDKTFK
jgi:hypothetical protein